MARGYRSTVRRAQSEATREAIVDAAHRLLKVTRPVDLAYTDVAAEAGVSVRTVYRAFPGSDQLFLAVSAKLFGELLPRPGPPETLDELLALLSATFRRLEADPALFRVMFAVPTRSPIRQPTLFARLFRAQAARLPAAERLSLFALIDLLGSPYAWDVMHHNWGLDADRAVRASIVSMQALVDYLDREPRALSTKSPPPKLLGGKKR